MASPSLGSLTERVTLQRPPSPQANQNAFGEVPDFWDTVAEVWAHVEHAGEPGAYEVTVRYIADAFAPWLWPSATNMDVGLTWRVVWGEQTLYVRDIQRPDGSRSRFMTLLCSTAK